MGNTMCHSFSTHHAEQLVSLSHSQWQVSFVRDQCALVLQATKAGRGGLGTRLTHIHTYTHAHIHTLQNAHTTPTHTHTHTHTHPHTHTHTQLQTEPFFEVTCQVSATSTTLIVRSCPANRELESIQCSINNGPQMDCEFVAHGLIIELWILETPTHNPTTYCLVAIVVSLSCSL